MYVVVVFIVAQAFPEGGGAGGGACVVLEARRGKVRRDEAGGLVVCWCALLKQARNRSSRVLSVPGRLLGTWSVEFVGRRGVP